MDNPEQTPEPQPQREFNKWTDVSADAKHIAGGIILHLWILLFVIPAIVGFLVYAIHNI